MNRKSYKARERDLEAVRLYKQGYTFRSISEALGCSIGTAHNAVKKAFTMSLNLSVEEADLIRQVELERLDDMFIPAYQKATEGDLKAVDTALRIMERRSKYLGLDVKPEKLSLADYIQVNFLPVDRLTDEQLEMIIMQEKAERQQSKDEK